MPILVLSSGFRPVIRSSTPYSLLGKAVIQHLSRHLQYGKHQKKLPASFLAGRRILFPKMWSAVRIIAVCGSSTCKTQQYLVSVRLSMLMGQSDFLCFLLPSLPFLPVKGNRDV